MTINKKTFLGAYYTFFVNGMMGLMLGTIIFFLSADYGIDYDMQGYLMSANSIGNLLASFSISISTFWCGRKRSIIIFSAVLLLAFGGIVSTSIIWLLFPLFFLAGLGRGSVSNVNYAIINDSAMGILLAIAGSGAILMPMITGFTAKSFGIHSGIIPTVISIVLTVVFAFALRVRVKE